MTEPFIAHCSLNILSASSVYFITQYYAAAIDKCCYKLFEHIKYKTVPNYFCENMSHNLMLAIFIFIDAFHQNSCMGGKKTFFAYLTNILTFYIRYNWKHTFWKHSYVHLSEPQEQETKITAYGNQNIQYTLKWLSLNFQFIFFISLLPLGHCPHFMSFTQ